jgi:hypothetical protein
MSFEGDEDDRKSFSRRYVAALIGGAATIIAAIIVAAASIIASSKRDQSALEDQVRALRTELNTRTEQIEGLRRGMNTGTMTTSGVPNKPETVETSVQSPQQTERSGQTAHGRLEVAPSAAVTQSSVATSASVDTLGSTGPRRNREPLGISEAGGITVALLGCLRIGGNVVCEMTLTSRAATREVTIQMTGRTTPTSRAFDLSGSEYLADEATLGSHGNFFPRMTLPSEIPVRATLVFRGVPATVSSFALLQLGYQSREHFLVAFRDVAISSA